MLQVYCVDHVPDAGCTCGALGKVAPSQAECSAYAAANETSMVLLFDDADVPEGCIMDIRAGEVISFNHVLSIPAPILGSANARPICWTSDLQPPASPPTPPLQPAALPPSEIAIGVGALGGIALLGFAVCALRARTVGYYPAESKSTVVWGAERAAIVRGAAKTLRDREQNESILRV